MTHQQTTDYSRSVFICRRARMDRSNDRGSVGKGGKDRGKKAMNMSFTEEIYIVRARTHDANEWPRVGRIKSAIFP